MTTRPLVVETVPIDAIVGEVDPDFICSVCNTVARTPLNCTNCDSLHCTECVKDK